MTDETTAAHPSEPAPPTTAGASVLTGKESPPPEPQDPASITALEVGISYIKGLGDAANPLLLILAAIKFAMVVAFFMHLRFDNRVLRRIFVTGFVLAVIVYFIVFFTLGVFTTAHGIHA
jgi:cytochrome c oxidase subunit 4